MTKDTNIPENTRPRKRWLLPLVGLISILSIPLSYYLILDYQARSHGALVDYLESKEWIFEEYVEDHPDWIPQSVVPFLHAKRRISIIRAKPVVMPKHIRNLTSVHFRNATVVSIVNNSVDMATVNHGWLFYCDSIEHLSINDDNVTDLDMDFIRTMQKLESLAVVSQHIRGDFLTHTTRNITNLSIHSPSFVGENLSSLSDFVKLESFSLHGAAIGQEHVKLIAQSKSIRTISFGDFHSHHIDLRPLIESNAYSIVLKSMIIEKADFMTLSKMKNLVNLTINDCVIGHDAYHGLDLFFPGLNLHISAQLIDDESVARFIDIMPNFKLSLTHPNLTPQGYQMLSKLNNVSEMTVSLFSSTQANFESLLAVSTLTNLQSESEISLTPYTAQLLKTHGKLKTLTLPGKHFDKKVADEIMSANPSLKITAY